jgi:hypothetical protein
MTSILTTAATLGLTGLGTFLATHGLMNSSGTEALISLAPFVAAAGVATWREYVRPILTAQLEVLKAKSLAQAAALKAANAPKVTVAQIAAQSPTMDATQVVKAIATLPPEIKATVGPPATPAASFPPPKAILGLALVAAFLGLLGPGAAHAQQGNRSNPPIRNTPALTGNPIQDIKNATQPAGASSEIKLTGDPIADLHAAITKGGAKLILHLKQSYALAMAKGSSGSADNTSAMCTRALVPIVDLVVNGPKMGTLDPADSMNLTSDEVTAAADTSEPEGPIVAIEKLRILRLAVTSPALNDACGALVQDEVKNAQALVGKITSLITGVGLLPAGL